MELWAKLLRSLQLMVPTSRVRNVSFVCFVIPVLHNEKVYLDIPYNYPPKSDLNIWLVCFRLTSAINFRQKSCCWFSHPFEWDGLAKYKYYAYPGDRKWEISEWPVKRNECLWKPMTALILRLRVYVTYLIKDTLAKLKKIVSPKLAIK